MNARKIIKPKKTDLGFFLKRRVFFEQKPVTTNGAARQYLVGAVLRRGSGRGARGAGLGGVQGAAPAVGCETTRGGRGNYDREGGVFIRRGDGAVQLRRCPWRFTSE